MRFVRCSAASLLIAFGVSVMGQGAALADGDAQKGKVAFVKNGCWQCHDYNGQGSVATSNGKVIARTNCRSTPSSRSCTPPTVRCRRSGPQVLSDAD